MQLLALLQPGRSRRLAPSLTTGKGRNGNGANGHGANTLLVESAFDMETARKKRAIDQLAYDINYVEEHDGQRLSLLENLARYLHDGETSIREDAVWALMALDDKGIIKEAECVYTRLQKMVANPEEDPNIRDIAGMILTSVGLPLTPANGKSAGHTALEPEDPSITERLLASIEPIYSIEQRMAAASGLMERLKEDGLNRQLLKAIQPYLNDEDERVRIEISSIFAEAALIDIDIDFAIVDLANLAGDSSEKVRKNAEKAISHYAMLIGSDNPLTMFEDKAMHSFTAEQIVEQLCKELADGNITIEEKFRSLLRSTYTQEELSGIQIEKLIALLEKNDPRQKGIVIARLNTEGNRLKAAFGQVENDESLISLLANAEIQGYFPEF